jgi:hypothetical protein
MTTSSGTPSDHGNARFEFAESNAQRIREFRAIPMTWAGFFGIIAGVFWYGVLTGYGSALIGAVASTAAAACGVAGVVLLWTFPPDWPTSLEVDAQSLRVRYDRKHELVIPWADPRGQLWPIDIGRRPNDRAEKARPILVATGHRIVVAAPTAALDALRARMDSQGYRFEPVLGLARWRVRWQLPGGSTVLKIVPA